MNKQIVKTGPNVAHSEVDRGAVSLMALGSLLGQRRAFAAVGGRCSAAHVQILRRIRDQKLYRSVAPSWRTFCAGHIALSRRHADRLTALLNRFGPAYFELAQLTGISPEQYLAIEPAVREDGIVVDGETLSLIPENSPRLLEAVDRILSQSGGPPLRDRSPLTLNARVADLAARGRAIANQLVELYSACPTRSGRDLIVEVATELRLILMQPGTE